MQLWEVVAFQYSAVHNEGTKKCWNVIIVVYLSGTVHSHTSDSLPINKAWNEKRTKWVLNKLYLYYYSIPCCFYNTCQSKPSTSPTPPQKTYTASILAKSTFQEYILVHPPSQNCCFLFFPQTNSGPIPTQICTPKSPLPLGILSRLLPSFFSLFVWQKAYSAYVSHRIIDYYDDLNPWKRGIL